MAVSYALHCVPAEDGVAVAPCGVVEGVALAPQLVRSAVGPLDYSGLDALFSFAVSIVLVCFVTAYTVGAIVRVVRST